MLFPLRDLTGSAQHHASAYSFLSIGPSRHTKTLPGKVIICSLVFKYPDKGARSKVGAAIAGSVDFEIALEEINSSLEIIYSYSRNYKNVVRLWVDHFVPDSPTLSKHITEFSISLRRGLYNLRHSTPGHGEEDSPLSRAIPWDDDDTVHGAKTLFSTGQSPIEIGSETRVSPSSRMLDVWWRVSLDGNPRRQRLANRAKEFSRLYNEAFPMFDEDFTDFSELEAELAAALEEGSAALEEDSEDDQVEDWTSS